MSEITCRTQGHLWGHREVCIMCGTPKPAEVATSKPRPVREDFPVGAMGDVRFANALCSWQYDEIEKLQTALAAGDRLAHELHYGQHGNILEAWWQARGGHEKCTVCNPPKEDWLMTAMRERCASCGGAVHEGDCPPFDGIPASI